MTDAEERVTRGAALLDEVADPDWREKLDVDTLQSVAYDPSGCVAERVYPGGFGAALARIVGTAADYGFNSDSRYDDVQIVQAWKNLVHRDLSVPA